MYLLVVLLLHVLKTVFEGLFTSSFYHPFVLPVNSRAETVEKVD
jgi:hypothetical protein